MAEDQFPGWHGTTIIGVRKGDEVVEGEGPVNAHLKELLTQAYQSRSGG